MKRLHQCLLIATFLPLCWLGMMIVHEAGHILAGYFTGGTVTKVVLHPLAISRTDVAPNPMPLIVIWSGPLMGVLLPLFLWGLLHLAKVPTYLPRFFAGFCLIANGAYISIGSFDKVGDAGVMQQHGSPSWLLWLFGVLTISIGFRLWHQLGSHFGFGTTNGHVDKLAAYWSLALFVIVLSGELSQSWLW